MCLIVFAWRQHPEYDLIVAANRDEMHTRPTKKADWWPDQPDLLAGRDLQAGGSWFGVTRSGRFATVTNYREQSFTRASHRSRGHLVTEFLLKGQTPAHYSSGLDGDDYAGFNLLTADDDSISYASNRGESIPDMAPGVYGLSNAALDTAWSKVLRSKERLRTLLDEDNVKETTLLGILADRETALEDVDAEHLTFEQARAITAPFIVAPEYGTRCSTVLLRPAAASAAKSVLIEQRFDAAGTSIGVSRYTF